MNSKMQNYTTILWDVDGTLLDFLASEKYAIKECFQHFELCFTEEILNTYSKINKECWLKLERGEVTKQWVLRERFVLLFEQYKIEDVSVEEFQERYQKQLGSVFYYNDNSFELIKELKPFFQQYIITNGVGTTQQNKLKLSGFLDLMDDVFISEYMGYEKPRKEFFEKCFEKIGNLEKEKVLVIGDSLTSDMLGANNFGIDCCYYNPFMDSEDSIVYDKMHGEVHVNYEIKSLDEVRTILWQNQKTKS